MFPQISYMYLPSVLVTTPSFSVTVSVWAENNNDESVLHEESLAEDVSVLLLPIYPPSQENKLGTFHIIFFRQSKI